MIHAPLLEILFILSVCYVLLLTSSSLQVGNTGFSIGAARKLNISLVIGPGAGYNSKSNPLPEEHVSTGNTDESKKQSGFQERIRAERESFRTVFDKRRQRIGVLDLEEE